MCVAKRSRNHLSWEMMRDVPAVRMPLLSNVATHQADIISIICIIYGSGLVFEIPAKEPSASSKALSVSTSRSFSGSSCTTT